MWVRRFSENPPSTRATVHWSCETGQGYTHPGGRVSARKRRAHHERRSQRRGDGQRGLDASGQDPGGADRGVHRRSAGGRSGHRGRHATQGTQGRPPRRRKCRRVAGRHGAGAGGRSRRSSRGAIGAPQARLKSRTPQNLLSPAASEEGASSRPDGPGTDGEEALNLRVLCARTAGRPGCVLRGSGWGKARGRAIRELAQPGSEDGWVRALSEEAYAATALPYVAPKDGASAVRHILHTPLKRPGEVRRISLSRTRVNR